jgi:C1A family cysteine protease
MSHIFNRKIPAPLPVHRMLTRTMLAPLQVVDLRKWCGPVKNQGNLGSCTGHAFSEALEWIFRRYLNQQPVLSPLFVYANELIDNGDFPQDNGSDGTTGSTVVIADGTCEDSLYPDSSQKIIQPTAEMTANAVQYKMGAYHGLAGSQVAISVLGDPTPWPVEVGFTVYASFESDEVESTGIYNPQPGENVLGGHEVLIVGYDIGETPTLRPANCPPAALIQNSWGTEWGLAGFFWMVLPVLDDAETDLKIVHAGGPWK